MTEPNMALTVTALKVASEYTKAAYDEARQRMADGMDRGDRKICVDPETEGKLAAITLTDPKPTVRISEQVLAEWMEREYPQLCERTTEIAGSDAEVIQVLFAHAPHLLRKRVRVKTDTVAEMKSTALVCGHPVGPGGEVDVPGVHVETPAPSLQCRPVEGAADRVVEMFRNGWIQLDGTVAPQIEGGTA